MDYPIRSFGELIHVISAARCLHHWQKREDSKRRILLNIDLRFRRKLCQIALLIGVNSQRVKPSEQLRDLEIHSLSRCLEAAEQSVGSRSAQYSQIAPLEARQ